MSIPDESKRPRGIRRLVNLPPNSARRDRALQDEIAFHLAMRVADLVKAGMSEADAKEEALRRFSDAHDMDGVRQWIEGPPIRATWRRTLSRSSPFGMLAVNRLRQATTRLVRAPSFALSVVLTLMLGIGVTAAVFAVVDGVLIRPLPFPRSTELVDLSHTLNVSGPLHVDQSDATYLLYRRENHVLSDIALYRATAINTIASASSAGGPGAERVPAADVTASLFHVLGIQPTSGRGLNEADEQSGARPVAVISDGYRHRAFADARSVIGRTLTIDGVDREIVGVMPSRFGFPSNQTEVWIPLVIDPARTRSAAFDYRGIGRLKGGVTVDAAEAELTRLLPRVPVVFPGRLTAGAIAATHMQTVVRPLRDVMVGDVSRLLWIVLGASAALFLLACANVANLFLARGEGRHLDLAVRRALGAGRVALLSEFLSEAVVLCAAGAAAGVTLASLGLHGLEASGWATRIPRLADVSIDWTVLLVVATVAIGAALAVTAVPALRAHRASPMVALVAHAKATLGGRTRSLLRRSLVVSQVALALVLLTAAGLFARSYVRLQAVDPGFRAPHGVSFRLALSDPRYATASDAARLIVDVQNRIGALPDIEAVGVITKLPLDDESRMDSAVYIETGQASMGRMASLHEMLFASPGYFRAMGIPLLAGRLFDATDPSRDPRQAPREVIVSRAFQEHYWRGQGVAAAIGKRIRMNPTDPWSTIVGVVGSVHDRSLESPPEEAVYSPLMIVSAAGTPWAPRDVAFVARTRGTDNEPLAPIARVVQELAPSLPVYRVATLADLVSRAIARTTFTLLLLGVAAVVAVLIGTAGIYGVIAYLVSLRTREMGVRLALGARPADVRRLITRHAMTDALVGIAIGLVAAAATMRFLAALLFGVAPMDPVASGGAAAVLLLAALAASWMPARRTARLDPAVSLRTD